MVESTGSSKPNPRDALLEKLRERIKERDRALEVNKHTDSQQGLKLVAYFNHGYIRLKYTV